MARQSRIEINLERELAREREISARLQKDLDEHRSIDGVRTPTGVTAMGGEFHPFAVAKNEPIEATLSSGYPPEVDLAILAVALRLEERADKRTLPNGAALCHVEELYERSGNLKALLGTITEHDEEQAQELLQELIGSR